MSHTPAVERVLARVSEQRGPLATPCWITSYKPRPSGYVTMTRYPERGSTLCHRVTYEHFVGAVPNGLTLDHLCRVRHCVNPAHLEPVTNRENFLRGEHNSARAVRDDTCRHGHSLLDAYPRKGGGRLCRTCHLGYMRARREVTT